MIIRGIVRTCIEGVIKRFAASGMIDVDDREYIQHYGLTSRPKEGAEIVYLVEGNVVLALGSDDRRCRLQIESGEVALYDDLGQVVHLTRSGISVTSSLQVTVDAPEIHLGSENLQALVDERILLLLNAHTHPVAGAVTGPMAIPLVSTAVCTQITKAA
jgi:hypothetical protein